MSKTNEIPDKIFIWKDELERVMNKQQNTAMIGFNQHQCDGLLCYVREKRSINDLWHNVKDEMPVFGEVVFCYGNRKGYAVCCYNINNISCITSYDKWVYVDDINPRE